MTICSFYDYNNNQRQTKTLHFKGVYLIMSLYDDYYDENYYDDEYEYAYEYDQWLLNKQRAEVEIEKLEEEYANLENNYTLTQNEYGEYVPDYDLLNYMSHVSQELDERKKDYTYHYYN